jgi:hypothetical protein
VGETLDCSTCFNVWTHFGWIMLNMKRHLHSKQEFTNWLTTMYLFYLITRIINFEEGVKLLPEMQQRVGFWDELQANFTGFEAYNQLATHHLPY